MLTFSWPFGPALGCSAPAPVLLGLVLVGRRAGSSWTVSVRTRLFPFLKPPRGVRRSASAHTSQAPGTTNSNRRVHPATFMQFLTPCCSAAACCCRASDAILLGCPSVLIRRFRPQSRCLWTCYALPRCCADPDRRRKDSSARNVECTVVIYSNVVRVIAKRSEMQNCTNFRTCSGSIQNV